MSLQLLTVQDQGFEAGIGDWVLQTNCTIAQTAAQARTGTKALALTSSAGGTMSAITGLVAIHFLLKLLRTRSFAPFVVYRLMAGAAVLLLIVTGFRPAT